jgi:SAM-dependent methyltransferase
MNLANKEEIRSRPSPDCYICGAYGQPLYQGLRDRLYKAPGKWNLKQCPNPECGLVWLDPMPLEEDIPKAYQHYFTHKYAVGHVNSWFRRLRLKGYQSARESYLAYNYGYQVNKPGYWRQILARLVYLTPIWRASMDHSVRYLNPRTNGLLLDVGCGDGAFLKEMILLGWQAEGVDFDPLAVENARKQGLLSRLGTLEGQDYPGNHYDAVTMNHFIEHIHDPLRSLCECHRILISGGNLVIVTPNVYAWGHRLFKDAWRALEPPRHLHLFTFQSLYKLAERAGFSKIKIWSSTRAARWILMVSREIRYNSIINLADHYSYLVKIWGRGMELIEWGISKANPVVGEEIVMLAEK